MKGLAEDASELEGQDAESLDEGAMRDKYS